MARDADLEDRVRAALSARSTVTEKAMFGGLAFMVDGKMVVSVGNGGGALLVRVPRERDDDYVGRPGSPSCADGRGQVDGTGMDLGERGSSGVRRRPAGLDRRRNLLNSSTTRGEPHHGSCAVIRAQRGSLHTITASAGTPPTRTSSAPPVAGRRDRHSPPQQPWLGPARCPVRIPRPVPRLPANRWHRQ